MVFAEDFPKSVFRSPINCRRGVSTLSVVAIVSIIAVIGLGLAALLLRPDSRQSEHTETVRIYCASGLVQPLEEIVMQYNDSHDSDVAIVRAGGSGELAGQIKAEFELRTARGADVYISADEQLIVHAQLEGRVSHTIGLARQRPVIAVAADRDDLVVANLNELVNDRKLKFGVASRRAAIGHLTRMIAQRDGLLDLLESRKSIDAENVMTLAQALRVGSLDAAIVWDTTVQQMNQLDMANGSSGNPIFKIAAPVDSQNQLHSLITIGVLSSTLSEQSSLDFANYLHRSDEARAIFQEAGFDVLEILKP